MQLRLEEIKQKWAPYFAQLPKPYFPLSLEHYEIRWNTRMRSRAGVCFPHKNLIELNPNILTSLEILEEVFVHELCHMAVALRWPYAQAHGPKWRQLMSFFGYTPKRCHELPVAKRHHQRRWPALCNCKSHLVSTIVYNRLRRGVQYKCLSCKGRLQHGQKTSTQAS